MNLAALAERHDPNSTALIDYYGTLSYGELNDGVARWRSALASAGVAPGDRVALACGNDRNFVLPYLAALGLGAIAAPLNPQSPLPELRSEFEIIDARVAVGAGPGAVSLSRLDRNAIDLVQLIVPDDSAGSTDFESPVIAMSSLVNGARAAVDRDEKDPAVLLFTSGTAGFPKAAMLTHGSLLANLAQIQSHPGREATQSDVGLGILPLFHVFGLNVILNLALWTGGSLVLLDRPDPEQALAAIESYGVTLLAGAPVLFELWAQLGHGPIRSLRMAISGASPLSSNVAESFEEAFSLPLWEGYGLTEASPVVSSGLMDGAPRRGSVGVPLPGIDVQLTDTDGQGVLVGDPGEIWVRGPNVFGGYWRDPQATRRVITSQGWLRTGDVAVSDEEGHLYIVDRLKDLIIVSGFNVYPQEVERVIAKLDAVADVAVVGKARAGGGESIAAHVVVRPGCTVTAGEVTASVESELAGYKVPHEIIFADSLPHGLSGEILRRELR